MSEIWGQDLGPVGTGDWGLGLGLDNNYKNNAMHFMQNCSPFDFLIPEHRVWSAAEEPVFSPLTLAEQRPPDRPHWGPPGPSCSGSLRGCIHVHVLRQ